MSLSAGDRLGPYEVVALIGAGGMGEVYRARDPRLGRDVAIKVSAERFSERFEREARVIASLNHPNTCHLYDVGPNYLVMELVEGLTLAERIKQGPIPLEEALTIARQIADALDAAHEKGITHRDLKPGNIKIKPDGTVKVLDFGLAKRGGTPTVQTDNSPTVTVDQTEAGMILGTAAYMSPEQAKGKPVDKRADIWAFGIVLYEMLTGKRLFAGETTTETLAAVIERTPQWDMVPAEVRRLLRRCLEKDPKRRLRDIGDALPLVEQAAPSHAGPRVESRRYWLAWGVAALLLVTLAPIVFLHVREKPPAPAPPVRFQVALPEKVTLTRGDSFAVSPDGRQLAFAAAGTDGVSRVWVRGLDSLEVRPLPGSEIGPVAAPLFWSPDSRYIVFQAETKLKKIDISGGPAQTLCDVTGFVVSGSWNRDGVIILGNNVSGRNGGALMRVPAAGGTCSPLTTLDPSRGENYHSFPSFLPDGRHFLYHRMSSAPQNAGIYVGSLDAKPEEQDSRQLLATPFGGRYVPPSDSAPGQLGQLLFVREGTLMAQPFDAQRMELSGEAIPVAEQLGSFLNFAYISVSTNGVLVYRSGATQDFQLTWFDRQGKALGTAGEQGQYSGVALSTDGTRAAVTHTADQDLWLMDLSRGTSTRFTFGPGRARNAAWSPDGSRLIFASSHEGVYDLYQKPASGAKEEEILLKSGDNKFPLSWSRDGHFLLYLAVNRQTRNDLWVLPLDGDRKPFPFLRTEFDETQGRFSPDARWIAYMSNESGRPEVYVRRFSPPSAGAPAETGGKWMVSKGGGNNPVWRGDGKELMYAAPDGKVMAVEVTANTAFQPGIPKALFQPPAFGQPADYDAGRDRSLLVVPVGQSTPPPFTVVLNWMAALKK